MIKYLQKRPTAQQQQERADLYCYEYVCRMESHMFPGSFRLDNNLIK